MYERGQGVSKDDAQAVAWYRKAAEQGNAGAQNNLGLMYKRGRGVAKDDVQAVAWSRKAAEQGDAAAQFNLGVMYFDGRGVSKDDVQAVAWFRKAAEQGDSGAQLNLGIMYANGWGVAKDDVQAVAWYRKAAEQGNSVAQFNLGVRYSNGRGVAKDDVQAVAWYRKAAEQGDADAQNGLGVMYADGLGVKKNHAWAVYWYAKAASQGNELALRNIENNVSHLIELRVRGGNVSIREEPNPQGQVVRQAKSNELAYRLATQDGWYEVYLPSGHTLGYIPVSSASVVDRASTQASSTPQPRSNNTGSIYPAKPAKVPGKISCNTNCHNGDCYRTYDSGKQVRFQAKRTFDPFRSEWVWDSGHC